MAHVDIDVTNIGSTPEGEYFGRNISALRLNNEAIAKNLAKLDSESDDPDYPGWKFRVRVARNGQLTLIACGDDSEVAVHSTYDPEREAVDQVNGALNIERRNFFVILGFGLGYAVEKLAEKTGPETKILVVEPHAASFRKALEARDLVPVLTDKRIIITLGSHVDNALAAFIARYNLADCAGVGFIELSGRNKLPSAKFYNEFMERLKGMIVTTGGNLQTLMLMAWQYQRNTMASIGHIADSPPVRTLFSAFEKKPAIIVSAGPSLSKNIDQLKTLRDNVVLIAVDTSVRPLQNAGVEPHLICTGDPQEANWRHLRGTTTKEPYLVAEPMTYPSSLEFFKGRLFIASYNDKVMQWLHKYIPDVGHVLCWGSVATMAFDLARKMGCDPIIFVGQDLSFPGGRTYVEGTYFETEEKQDMSVEAYEKNHGTYNMTDIFGQPVKTNRQMFAYKEWFRSEFARTDAKVVNCTEGGILRENCEIRPLKEAAEMYIGDKFDAMSVIRGAAGGFEGYDLDPLRKGMFENIASMKRCLDICEIGVNRLKEVVNAVEGMDTLSKVWCAGVIKDLDTLRFKLIREQALKDFLETANQTGMLNFQRAYKAVNGKQFSRVIFREALDLYTNLFMSTGKTARTVIPFFMMGFKILAERDDAGLIQRVTND